MADRLWTGATCRVGFPARATGFLGERRKELKPMTGKGERGYRGVGVNSDGKFGAAGMRGGDGDWQRGDAM